MKKTLDLELFEEKIIFEYNTSLESMVKKYNIDRDDYKTTSNGIMVPLINQRTNSHVKLIWLEEYDVEILIHEIYHVIWEIFNKRGINDSETGAYMMGYIYKKLVVNTKELKDGNNE